MSVLISQDGKKQAYDLGVYTRKRYENFLPSIYSEEDFYAYTTDVDRTHMSAQAYIAGLYPPSETDQWSNQIHWQPIPVHPLPNHLLEIKNCPVYFDTVAKSLDEQFQQFISSNKDIVESVSKYAGLNSTDMTQLALVYDTLYIESIVGYPLPEWAKSVLSETFAELFTDFVGIHGYSDLLQRLGEYITDLYYCLLSSELFSLICTMAFGRNLNLANARFPIFKEWE